MDGLGSALLIIILFTLVIPVLLVLFALVLLLSRLLSRKLIKPNNNTKTSSVYNLIIFFLLLPFIFLTLPILPDYAIGAIKTMFIGNKNNLKLLPLNKPNPRIVAPDKNLILPDEPKKITPKNNLDNSSERSLKIVTGYVTAGGDTTPTNTYDLPRYFLYTVRKDDGTTMYITYTAYPPAQMNSQIRKNIRLNFCCGSVNIGNYLRAFGTFDPSTNTLTVVNEGDYLETYQDKNSCCSPNN